MATNKRSGTRDSNRGRSGPNNNPEGRNQYSGVTGMARGKPFATVAAFGGVVAAGAFLWSRRNELSEQIGNLATQVSDWREGMESGRGAGNEASGESFMIGSNPGGSGRSQTEISEEALTLKETGKTA